MQPKILIAKTDMFLPCDSVAIGVRCKDGIVLAVEKLVISKLLVKGANRRIVAVDDHVGLVSDYYHSWTVLILLTDHSLCSVW